jgi:hypothetical protein
MAYYVPIPIQDMDFQWNMICQIQSRHGFPMTYNVQVLTITRSLVCFMCMFCRSLFALFLLPIVLSVHLRFTDSHYSFGIFKLFLYGLIYFIVMWHKLDIYLFIKNYITSFKLFCSLIVKIMTMNPPIKTCLSTLQFMDFID